jgi:hypothetical protein
MIGVRIPVAAGNFSPRHRVQTASGAHLVSYPMGTKGYFPGGKEVGEPVSIAERSKASTVFGRSNIGITVSNPARGTDVCLRLSVLCWLSCVGRGVALD